MNRIAKGARYTPVAGSSLLQDGRIVAIISVLVVVAARYAFEVLIARTTGAGDFGRYALITGYAIALSGLAGMGLPELSSRHVPRLLNGGRSDALKAFIRHATWLICIAGLGLAGVAAAIGASIGGIMGEAGILILLVPVFAVFNLRRRLALAAHRVSIGMFAPALASFGASVLFGIDQLLTGSSSWLDALVAVFISYCITITVMIKGLNWTSSEPVTSSSAKLSRIPWVRPGMVILGSNVATLLTTQVDVFLVVIFATPEEVGVYAAASRLSMIVTIALAGVSLRDAPRFGQLGADNRVYECWLWYRRSALVTGAVGLVVALIVSVLGGNLLAVYGAEFRSGAVWLAVLSIGRSSSAITGPVAELLIALGGEREAALTAWLGLIVAVVAILLLGSLFGLVGVALGTSLGIAVQNLTQVAAARRLRGAAPKG